MKGSENIPLRELHLPEIVSWWPLAPGWWFLIVCAVALVAIVLRMLWRRWRVNAARRLALARLSTIHADFEHGKDAVALGKALSELLRRAMLAYAPRSEVAGLAGQAWLEWLDRGLDARPFTTGAGVLLQELPYLDPRTVRDDTDVSGLIAAVRSRLQSPISGEAA